VPWQTLSLEPINPAPDVPAEWRAALERINQECDRALVPRLGSVRPYLIEHRTLYLERSAAVRVLCWRRSKERTTIVALTQPLSPAEQAVAYAALEGLALPQSVADDDLA